MARGPRRPKRFRPLTNIRRDPGAWTVTVLRKGQTFADYFGDQVWGGRKAALVAAQRFRDQTLLRVEPDTRVRRRIPKGTRSATGIVGVTFERYVVDGRLYHRYIAHWPDPNVGKKRRRFLVECYGRNQARVLVMQARKAGVAPVHARELARQREEARRRLRDALPMPRQVKDPKSRKGISMARRRPRRVR